MLSRRPSDFGISLLLAAGAIAATAAVVFVAGQLVLPAEAPPPPPGAETTAPTMEDLSGSQAILLLSGDHEGRHQLNRLSVGEYNEGVSPDDPLKLSLTFRNDNVSMLITANDIESDTPATGPAASAIIGVEGANYFGNNGECTITLESVDYEVLEPLPAVQDGVPRGVPIPIYAGTVECQEIKEIRTDRRIDLYAVFQYQPQQ